MKDAPVGVSTTPSPFLPLLSQLSSPAWDLSLAQVDLTGQASSQVLTSLGLV